MMRVCAVAMFAIGCTHPAPGAPVAPRAFSCHGDAAPEDKTWDGLPVGRLDIHRIAGDANKAPDQVRLRVLAEGTPLAAFAGALSDALGIPATVDQDMLGARVALAFPEIDLLGLWRALATTQSIQVTLYNRGIHFTRDVMELGTLDEEGPPQREPPVINTLLVVPTVEPEQFASAFCQQVASPQGEASVLGKGVLLTDRPDHLKRAEALLKSLR
jgi:hypothetical protein